MDEVDAGQEMTEEEWTRRVAELNKHQVRQTTLGSLHYCVLLWKHHHRIKRLQTHAHSNKTLKIFSKISLAGHTKLRNCDNKNIKYIKFDKIPNSKIKSE